MKNILDKNQRNLRQSEAWITKGPNVRNTAVIRPKLLKLGSRFFIAKKSIIIYIAFTIVIINLDKVDRNL